MPSITPQCRLYSSARCVGVDEHHFPASPDKLQEAKVADINTTVGGTTLAAIGALHGRAVVESVLPLTLSVPEASLQITGFVTNATYNGKRSLYVIFVNNRLVEMPSFRSAMEAAYHTIQPKVGSGSKLHPFVYCNIQVPTANVDVVMPPWMDVVADVCSSVARMSILPRAPFASYTTLSLQKRCSVA